MKNLIICLIFLFALANTMYAQETNGFHKLDHKTFIEELNNSQERTYNNILKTYDDYLAKYPEDISAQIEKCKFVQYAQYDEYDDYNPNQEYFDSCAAVLLELHPNHQDVLVFHTTFLWGDEIKDIFEKAEKSISKNVDAWSKTNIGIIYNEIALQHYYDDEFPEANNYMEKACSNDDRYASSIEYARILIELEKNEEAIKVLVEHSDTTNTTWQLSQKAELFLKLKAYSNALDLYNFIYVKDSSFNNNEELAQVMEGIGEYELARGYLVDDTSMNWNTEAAMLKLLLHDIKYQSGDTCLNSYNAYRDLGYYTDPLAIYRLKLFVSNPLLPWKIHDISGLLSLLLLAVLFFILPSVWILPVYFIGHKWKIIDQQTSNDFIWGLKSFWWVSSGYLIASFLCLLNEPEFINAWINWTEYSSEYSQEQEGFSTLLFIAFLAFFGFATLYKVHFKVLLPKYLTIRKSITITLGFFVVFKIITFIYLRVGTSVFDIEIERFMAIPNTLLSSREEILALLSNYGYGVGFLLIGFIVPIYEEIIFRGVILEASKRYLNYNWANIFQAALFALIHGDLFLFPVFFAFGIIAGVLNKKSGGLFSGIIFHIVNNSLVLAVLMARGF